jgi:hypothetical protein
MEVVYWKKRWNEGKAKNFYLPVKFERDHRHE